MTHIFWVHFASVDVVCLPSLYMLVGLQARLWYKAPLPISINSLLSDVIKSLQTGSPALIGVILTSGFFRFIGQVDSSKYYPM
jgi:hypothetical protein